MTMVSVGGVDYDASNYSADGLGWRAANGSEALIRLADRFSVAASARFSPRLAAALYAQRISGAGRDGVRFRQYQ